MMKTGWLSSLHIQYLVPDSVHLVGCLECQQTGLLNLNTGLCNIIQDSALFCKRLPKRNSLLDLDMIRCSCDTTDSFFSSFNPPAYTEHCGSAPY